MSHPCSPVLPREDNTECPRPTVGMPGPRGIQALVSPAHSSHAHVSVGESPKGSQGGPPPHPPQCCIPGMRTSREAVSPCRMGPSLPRPVSHSQLQASPELPCPKQDLTKAPAARLPGGATVLGLAVLGSRRAVHRAGPQASPGEGMCLQQARVGLAPEPGHSTVAPSLRKLLEALPLGLFCPPPSPWSSD